MTAPSLTGFLLARYAEDEEVARAASEGHVWTWDERGDELLSDHRGKYGPECIIDTEGANPPGPQPGEHIARHDPARVLADVEAKRRIVEDFAHLSDVETGPLSKGPLRAHAEYVVRILAAVYADHPDYDPNWKP